MPLPILNWIFSLLNFESSLYVLYNSILLHMWFGNILSEAIVYSLPFHHLEGLLQSKLI